MWLLLLGRQVGGAGAERAAPPAGALFGGPHQLHQVPPLGLPVSGGMVVRASGR